jgi:hypothetical protein
VLIASLLSACVDIELSSEYHIDGTASHAVRIQVAYVPTDREDVDNMEAILADLEERTINAGLEYERSDEPGVVTIQISGTTSEGEEAGAALNSLLNATGLNASPGVTAPFRGTFEREAGAVGGSSYTLDLSVDGALLFESVVIERVNSDPSLQRESVSMFYVASFPGDVTETSGEELDDRTVRWEIPFDGTTELTATARTGGAGSAALFIIVGVAALIVIIAIAAGLAWYFSRRKRLSMTLGGAIHRIPGQQTVTSEGIWVARKINEFTYRLGRNRREPPDTN